MRIGIIRVMRRILMLMRFRVFGGLRGLMNACMHWLGVGEGICTSYGGAERASLVLRYGMPVGRASFEYL